MTLHVTNQQLSIYVFPRVLIIGDLCCIYVCCFAPCYFTCHAFINGTYTYQLHVHVVHICGQLQHDMYLMSTTSKHKGQ